MLAKQTSAKTDSPPGLHSRSAPVIARAPLNAVLGASIGLLSMEERAALAGGNLAFKSAPGAGTEVHAWLPLKWLNAGAASKSKSSMPQK